MHNLPSLSASQTTLGASLEQGLGQEVFCTRKCWFITISEEGVWLWKVSFQMLFASTNTKKKEKIA